MNHKGMKIEISEDGLKYYIRYQRNGKWFYGLSGYYTYPYTGEDGDTRQVLDCRSTALRKMKSILSRKYNESE